MAEFSDDLDAKLLLHTAGDSLIGRAMIVKAQKTGPDQIDLYCGSGDDVAIICIAVSDDGYLMCEMTDPSEDDDKRVVFKRIEGAWRKV
jgi:hypothetical protein